MSGSKKGSPRRPYRVWPKPTGCGHVLFRTPEEAASDAWEHGMTEEETRDFLNQPVGSPAEARPQ